MNEQCYSSSKNLHHFQTDEPHTFFRLKLSDWETFLDPKSPQWFVTVAKHKEERSVELAIASAKQ